VNIFGLKSQGPKASREGRAVVQNDRRPQFATVGLEGNNRPRPSPDYSQEQVVFFGRILDGRLVINFEPKGTRGRQLAHTSRASLPFMPQAKRRVSLDDATEKTPLTPMLRTRVDNLSGNIRDGSSRLDHDDRALSMR